MKIHRIIWFLEKGCWPDVIDHIDGDGLNNRIDNLRDVSQAENMRNAARPNDNTSGRVGVSRLHRTDHWGDCWQAYINVRGKRIALGLFKSFEHACLAREDAERQYGYHANHGRAAA
ncbi:HNH endonuclease signature motif containing protein [Borborobacter arsenicus]